MAHGRTRNRLAQLLHQHRGLCAYCLRPVYKKSHRSRDCDRATIDHIVPRSRGGTDAWVNLTLACLACNEAKADGPAVWRAEAPEAAP
jgi:5-methylcytosine-specific restriction endonuclease McrA